MSSVQETLLCLDLESLGRLCRNICRIFNSQGSRVSVVCGASVGTAGKEAYWQVAWGGSGAGSADRADLP